jgi:hypothetical protein
MWNFSFVVADLLFLQNHPNMDNSVCASYSSFILCADLHESCLLPEGKVLAKGKHQDRSRSHNSFHLKVFVSYRFYNQ